MSPIKLSILLLAGLGASGVATAATRTVGDAACVAASTCDYPSLRVALLDAQLADGDVIVIQSDVYLGGERFLPHIFRSITIESTGGSDATAPIPSLYTTAAALTVAGLTIDAGEGTDATGFVSVSSGIEAAGTDIVGDDVAIRPRDEFTQAHGVRLYDGTLDLADFAISGFRAVGYNGIEVHGSADVALLNGSIADNTYGVYLGGWASVLTMDTVTLSGHGGYALYVAPEDVASVSLVDCVLSDNDRSAVMVDWYPWARDAYAPRFVAVADTLFDSNHESYNGLAADITFHPLVGGVTVTGSTFRGWEGAEGSIHLNGGDNTFSTSTWSGADGGGYGEEGGAIFAAGGTLRLTNDRFENTGAQLGGALYLAYDPYDIYSSPVDATIESCTFSETAATYGGAIWAASGTNLRVNRSTFAFNEASNEGGDILFGSDFSMKFPVFGTLTVTASSFEGSYANLGAVLALIGPYQRATIRGATISETYAGTGGIFTDAGNTLTIEDTTVTNASAKSSGAFVASFDRDADYPYSPTDLPSCEYLNSPYGHEVAAISGGDAGSEVTIIGTTVTGADALIGALGVFGPYDEVVIRESTFEDSYSAQGPNILGADVSRFDMSCTTMCTNGTGSDYASGIYLWDSGGMGSRPGDVRGGGKSVAYTFTNNVFQEQTGRPGFNTLLFELCAPGDRVKGTREPAVAGVGQGDSDTGAPPATPRGRFDIVNNTFIGPANLSAAGAFGDGALVRGRAQDVRLHIGNNIFQSAHVGIKLQDSPWVDGDYNLFGSDLTNPLRQDALLFFPAAHDILSLDPATDASYIDYRPGECDSFLGLLSGTSGFDQGDPALLDWDDSRSDMGAYGGPGACIPDRDGDGHNRLEDCDDDVGTIYPGAGEIPYDTIDQDCDTVDLCDVDADGFDADHVNCGGTDCNDANPGINPGIVEVGTLDLYANGVDEDCDGDDWCDLDGDGFFANSETCGGPDCDDDDEDIHPGATEIPYNGIAEGCVRDLCDVDGDGFDATSAASNGNCDGTDCNDDSVWIHPEAPEVPYDEIDNDCRDGDECDVDNDGFVAAECGGDDCDDSNADIHPGAEDSPDDDIDANCDGDCDLDEDGHRSTACDGGTDCNDADPLIHIDAIDIPYNGIDEDCDGADECDVDNDSFLATVENCGGDDCNDEDATIHPGASEIPDDGIDQDCEADDVTRWIQGGCGCEGEDPNDCSTGGGAPTRSLWLLGLGLALWRRRRNPSSRTSVEA